jgi:mRNA interferase RelE/StbE
MELQVKRTAEKDLLALQRVDRERIEERIDAYLAHPTASHHDVRPVIGKLKTYRLRVGDWRVIFELDDGMMILTRVAHRREVYR